MDPSASDTLLAGLALPSWQARRPAFETLRAMGADAVPILVAGAAHPDWRVRRECADLMDHLADDRCVPSLRRMLDDPSPDVRRLAVHALGCQQCKACALDTDVAALLIGVAQRDPSARVRQVAVHQLGCQPPDPRIRAALDALLAESADLKLLSRARWARERQEEPAAGENAWVCRRGPSPSSSSPA